MAVKVLFGLKTKQIKINIFCLSMGVLNENVQMILIAKCVINKTMQQIWKMTGLRNNNSEKCFGIYFEPFLRGQLSIRIIALKTLISCSKKIIKRKSRDL